MGDDWESGRHDGRRGEVATMTLVTIHYGGQILATSLNTTVEERSQASRSYGSATLVIPREDVSWDHPVLSPRGGMIVTIGGWRGIADIAEWGPESVTI